MHSDQPFSLGYKSTRSPPIPTNSWNLVRTKNKYPYLRPMCTLDMSPGPGHVTQSHLGKKQNKYSSTLAPPLWSNREEIQDIQFLAHSPNAYFRTRFTTRGSALSGCIRTVHQLCLEIACCPRGLKRLHPCHHSQISSSDPISSPHSTPLPGMRYLRHYGKDISTPQCLKNVNGTNNSVLLTLFLHPYTRNPPFQT